MTHERKSSEMLAELQSRQQMQSVQHTISSLMHEQNAMHNARHEKHARVEALKQRVAEENGGHPRAALPCAELS
jgi:hypothetical protein